MTPSKKDFNDYRDNMISRIEADYQELVENGYTDSASNFLYFLRDDINKLIKKENSRLKKLNNK